MLRTFGLIVSFVAGTVVQALALSVTTDPHGAPPGTYQLESKDAQIQFAIRHFGVSDFFGRFDKASGALTFNPADPSRSAVTVVIDITSLSTQSSALDKELADPAIFNSAKFPTATFKSTSVTPTGANTGTIAGDLTIKGITKQAVLDVRYNGSTPSPLDPKSTWIGFHATTTIKRSDYDMTGVMWSSMVGDDVRLDIEAPFAATRE